MVLHININSLFQHSEKSFISCEEKPAMDNMVAREGKEQRIVPASMAAKDNEIGQH